MSTHRILSLGAGVQSTTLALMMKHGDIPAVEAAIFADTQWEPDRVYKHLVWLTSVLPFPVYRVTNGSVRENVLGMAGRTRRTGSRVGERYAAVPFFVLNTDGTTGIGRRQCTSEYKLVPLYRKARELTGLRRGQPSKAPVVTFVIGISADEAHRMKDARERWYQNEYPLVEKRIRRGDCIEWLRRNGYPIPPKSSCLCCPFHTDELWRELRDANAEEWQDVVEVDRLLRTGGPLTGVHGLQYMHRSLRPLGEVAFRDDGQLELDLFGNECEGMCGV